MSIPRPLRTVKRPARFEQAATTDELLAHIGGAAENNEQKPSTKFCNTTNTTTNPPPTPQKRPRKRQKQLKASETESQVVAIVPSANSAASMVVTGETITEVLATAMKTVVSTTLEDYITDDEHGKPVNRPKRKAQLKTQKQLDAEALKAEKIDLGKLSQKDFASRLIDAKTVEFEPFQEGPRREPKPIYPTDLDLDSPLAIFSLFWTEEMWQILAKNTNAYALRQGAVERGRDHTGARQHHGNWTINQRAWWPTNADELKVSSVLLSIWVYIQRVRRRHTGIKTSVQGQTIHPLNGLHRTVLYNSSGSFIAALMQRISRTLQARNLII